MLPCQGQRGGGSGEGTFLPLNFHLYLSVLHRGHPAVYQSLSWWGGSMVLSPSHIKTTSPWASFHTQPSVGPSCLLCAQYGHPCWPDLLMSRNPVASGRTTRSSPRQVGAHPQCSFYFGLPGFKGDFGNRVQVRCQPCWTRGRHMVSPWHVFAELCEFPPSLL